MAAPDHPPSADSDTSSHNGRDTPQVSSGMPPSYSNLFPRPSYSDLFPRPSYSDFFPRRPPPCNMDPLIEAMWHNQTVSDLPRWPDNVLRSVIRNLDSCGLECLRRVSRRFTPLCDQEILTRPRTYKPRWEHKDRGGPFAWPRFKVFSGPWEDGAAAERQRLLQLLARDWYCKGCREAREAPDWDQRVRRLTRYLYCYGCDAGHPACLFSAQQRVAPSRRRCIAHEGYIRLCQHDEGIVRWSDILRIRKRLEEGIKNKEDLEIRCEDISHVVPCAHAGTQRAGQRIFDPHCSDNHCIEQPSPTLSVDGSSIRLSWTAHLPVEPNGGQLTAVSLRPRIAEIRESGGRFLYPTVTFSRDMPEMRCFDPNDCDCVSLEGHGNVKLRPSSSLNSKRVCRLNPSRQLYSMCPSSSSSPSWSAAPLAHGIQRLLLAPRKKCGLSPKRHTARLELTGNSSGPGCSNVQCWPCHSGDSCLVLDYTRRLRFDRAGAIDIQWYQALDPDSYSLTEDEQGFEIYWCSQNECRNYHGRLPGFSRIVRGTEYHKSVNRTGGAHGFSRIFRRPHRAMGHIEGHYNPPQLPIAVFLLPSLL